LTAVVTWLVFANAIAAILSLFAAIAVWPFTATAALTLVAFFANRVSAAALAARHYESRF
jgi:hypothetical protein